MYYKNAPYGKEKIFSFEVKLVLILGALILFVALIGIFDKDTPKKPEPWLPPIDYEAKAVKLRSTSNNPASKTYQEPWSEDRREETENWADFLEELETTGYSVDDPEAEEIWEKFK
ncbi:MAG: hypothetical protein KKF98_11255 [Bacteroidetes bacterium]|nr:hypothetical protein [Bacteroidota bacterium]